MHTPDMGPLKGIGPLLTADVLHVLRSMGHGNKLVVCDCNFPAGARLLRPRVFSTIRFRVLDVARSSYRHLCRRARVSRNRHAHDDGIAHRPDRAPPRGAGRDLQHPTAGLLRGGAGDVHGAEPSFLFSLFSSTSLSSKEQYFGQWGGFRGFVPRVALKEHNPVFYLGMSFWQNEKPEIYLILP